MRYMQSLHHHRLAATFVVAAALLLAACNPNSEPDRPIDPANELPIGFLDIPANGAQVGASEPVGGWALDDRGIREIRLFLDGHFYSVVPLNTDRPDVSKAYPAYAKNQVRHGWTTSVTFPQPGTHSIIAQAVDSDGATRDIGVVTVTSKQ